MIHQDENGMIKIHKSFVIAYLVAMLALVFAFIKLEDADKKTNSKYVLVSYTHKGDTLAVYRDVTDYRFRYPNVIIKVKGKEITIRGNYSIYK